MPVDLQRVQSQRAEYERSWQARRRGRAPPPDAADDAPDGADSPSSGSAAISTSTIDQALEARATVSRLAFQLQQLQRSSDKKNQRDQRDQLGEELGRARVVLAQKLELLPNWIDWEVVLDQQEEDSTGDGVEEEAEEPKASADASLDEPSIPEDPLFCLGGYEELLSSSSGSDCGVVVLTGPGCQLALALTRFVRDSIHAAAAAQHVVSAATNNLTWYDLPATLPALVQQQQQQHIPSWKVLLERQHGSLLWDRQLPQVHLLQCSSSGMVGTGSSSLPGQDLRETARRQSWQPEPTRKNKKKPQVPRCWHQRLQPPSPQIQILALTGPSLAADSRPCQQSLCESLCAMYQQLLANDNDDDYDSNAATVRVRAVPPHELTPMESSRLVVEGLWRQRCSKGSKRRRPAVCLAYISNLQHYFCTANNSKIRHGTTKEGLHVLQGTLYSTAETLEWLCQNRATPHGVSMPRVLRQHDHLFGKGDDWMAYRRKVTVKKKGGKKIVEDIVVPAAAPASHVSKSNSRKTKNINGSSSRPGQQGESDSLPLPQPTAERIRAEALSTPFHFLPFYYR